MRKFQRLRRGSWHLCVGLKWGSNEFKTLALARCLRHFCPESRANAGVSFFAAPDQGYDQRCETPEKTVDKCMGGHFTQVNSRFPKSHQRNAQADFSLRTDTRFRSRRQEPTMCGLSGYVELGGSASAHDRSEPLRRMTRKLANRGPDAEGYFEQGPAHLGHRRLSVIDIEASRQPMATADGRFNLVYNGEVYNFKALRAELQAAGLNFRTAGDTEGVLQSIANWGEKSLDKLQGMFALAARDSVQQSLFWARHHM